MPRQRRDDPPITILIDTREQRPFEFAAIRGRGRQRNEYVAVATERATLPVGDYGVRLGNLVLPVAVERKSVADLYQSISTERARFEREMQRAASHQGRAGGGPLAHFALVVESDLAGLRTPPPHISGVSPTAVTRTLLSWSVRFGVHVWTPGPRAAAEQVTYRLLESAALQMIAAIHAGAAPANAFTARTTSATSAAAAAPTAEV